MSKQQVQDLYYARRGPFRYGPPNRDKMLDWGQTTPLLGLRNDKLLVNLGHFDLVPDGTELYQCDTCGESFIGMTERENHYRLRHTSRRGSPLSDDQRLDEHYQMLEQVAPVHLEKTAASSKGG